MYGAAIKSLMKSAKPSATTVYPKMELEEAGGVSGDEMVSFIPLEARLPSPEATVVDRLD